MVNPDYNILTPYVIDTLLERPIETALGKKEIERINAIQANYDYYHGKQEVDEFGNYVFATDDDEYVGGYKKDRFWTNYYKAFIKRKSRWQMAGDHGINVIPKNDDESSREQAQQIEALLYELWETNRMEANKMQIARERLIAGSIVCKIVFNERTGRLHWIWHKATEVFPVYSQDGFNDLVGCDIIIAQEDEYDFNKTQYVRQTFRLDEETNECWFDEVLFNEQLEERRVIQPKTYLGFDFIPIVVFDINTLTTEDSHLSDLNDLKVITRTLNRMMEDANESLKYEMFAMTVVKNADIGPEDEIDIAPGALLKLNSSSSTNHSVDVGTVETSFKWTAAFNDQYNRMKSVLHELAGLPQITPTELNFGGINGQTIQVLYQEIIQETEEHWLMWNDDFAELFQKSIWYLKERTHSRNFKYDVALLDKTDVIKTKMHFVLPLPDNRKELVDLILTEVEGGLESRKNGMQRLGVKSPDKKMSEIYEEQKQQKDAADPYSEDARISVLSPVEAEDPMNNIPDTSIVES